MKNNKSLTTLAGAAALLILPLLLQGFGNAWVRIADQSLLYVPRLAAAPNTPDFERELVEAVLPVLEASRGRAFFLFTLQPLLLLPLRLLPFLIQKQDLYQIQQLLHLTYLNRNQLPQHQPLNQNRLHQHPPLNQNQLPQHL